MIRSITPKIVGPLVFLVSTCCAQPPAEPEFIDTFFQLNAGRLVPLERQVSSIRGHASGFIILSMRGVAEIPGANSPFRLPVDQPIEFIVRGSNQDVDPASLYCLRKLESSKNKREVLITVGHATPVGARMDTSISRGLLPVSFAKYGSSSYRLSTEGLPPGEYAVGRRDARVLFCFGINGTYSTSNNVPTSSVEQSLMSIKVDSSPTEANVEVDGYPAGRTPADVKLQKGEYTLKVTKNGYQAWTQKLVVELGKAQSIGVALAAQPPGKSAQ